ncbi:MAG TPA: hypothetical protein V6D18_03725 [Thermosynechococcaceae cyanobacterium]
MSQRDNFAGGFLLGSIVGGVVGGVLGAVLTKQLSETAAEELLSAEAPDPKLKARARKRSLQATNGSSDIEAARHSLEDKIAQLNDAIDDVRQQLGGIDSSAVERSTFKEP